MTSMKNLQETHDRMIADGETCPDDCIYCSGEYAASVGGIQVADKTYTEEESQALIAAAVAEATAEAKSEIAVLKAAEEAAKKKSADDKEDEKDGGYDEDKEKTSLMEQVADLTLKLDASVLEAEAAKRERDELASWLQSEADKVVAEAELATRKADRIAKVAEVVTFPESHIAERADMWASLDDEKFEALLADYKALDVKPSTESGPLPHFTAMQAARDEAGSSVMGSAMKDIIRGRALGVDIRKIR